MDTKDLHVFVEVFEAKSINKASQKLFITPQGCGRIIRKIEVEIGVPLFVRSHYGLEPTIQGLSLYRRAQTIINLLDDIHTARSSYTLQLSFAARVLEWLGIDFIQDFQNTYPGIVPMIRESTDKAVQQNLLSGEAEIGIFGGPIDPKIFISTPIVTYALCLVINEKHPLAKNDTISYKDLDGQSMIIPSRDYTSYHMIMNRLKHAGIRPRVIVEPLEIDFCHRLAGQNAGIAVSFEFLAARHAPENTVIRHFAGPDMTCTSYIAHKGNTTLSLQADIFKTFTLKWIKEKNLSQA